MMATGKGAEIAAVLRRSYQADKANHFIAGEYQILDNGIDLTCRGYPVGIGFGAFFVMDEGAFNIEVLQVPLNISNQFQI